MVTKVFIDGEVGTTGLQIRERLAGRTDIERITLDEANRKDANARAEVLRAADIAILCLPDIASREAYNLVQGHDTRLLDASTAHRTAPGWVFGFPEMTKGQAEKIAQARYVANPGCFPTGAIALLRPLRDAGVLPADYPVSIQALSGYSGGGKAMIAEFEAATTPQDKPLPFYYGLAQAHKHLPEMQAYADLAHAPVFVPSVADFAQGMIVEIPLHLRLLDTDLAAIHHTLTAHYEGAPFVDVAPLGEAPARLFPHTLKDTNMLELSVYGRADTGTAVLIAVLDNLGKGASGAAVQNLNIMMGVDAKTGL